MRPSPPLLSILLGACLTSCAGEPTPKLADGLKVAVAPLTLPGLSKVCYDLEVNNGPDHTGETVWSRGTPGLNGGTPDGDAICSTEYGNGGGADITYIGPCDADGQEDADPAGERMNSVTLWFDGLYDEGGDYIAPDGPQGWQNPCVDATGAEVGCTLNVLCEENADALVEFNFTILREANQGFFDVAVNFNDIFCSAKFDCSYAKEGVCSGPGGTCTTGTLVEGKTACDTNADCVVQDPINLLHNADGDRAKTFVLGFACTAGPGTDVETELYLDNLEFDCNGDADPDTFTPDFTLSTAGIDNGNQCTAGEVGECAALGLGTETIDPNDFVYQLAIYRGEEALADAATDEPLNKKYWNLALGVNPAIAGCKIRIAGTAEDANDPNDGVQDRAVAPGHVYPVIGWEIDAATCTQEQASAAPAGGFFANGLTAGTGQVRMLYTSPLHAGFSFANALSATLPPTERCSVTRPCADGYRCTAGGECLDAAGWPQPECTPRVKVFDPPVVPLAAGRSTSGLPAWEPFKDGRVGVEQKANTVPSVYPTALDAQDQEIVFDLHVWPERGPKDDDDIGWTVNAQGTATTLGVVGQDFMLFKWDGMNPNRTTGDAAVGRQPGLRLFRVSGSANAASLMKPSGPVQLVQAATNLGSTVWTYGHTYRVRMLYSTTRIQVWVRSAPVPDDGGQLEFGPEELELDVADVAGTFPEGRLGFYTASQRSARFEVVQVEHLTPAPHGCQDPACVSGVPAVITNIEEVGDQVRFHYALCGNRMPSDFNTAIPSCEGASDPDWSNAGNPDRSPIVKPRPANFASLTSCTLSFYGQESITTPPYLKCDTSGPPEGVDPNNWGVGYDPARSANDPIANPYDGGKIYFIDSNGDDNNDGLSEATPWKTFGKANSTVQAGDIVYVRDGIYQEEVTIGSRQDTEEIDGKTYPKGPPNPLNRAVGEESKPITWRSYPGEIAIIEPPENDYYGTAVVRLLGVKWNVLSDFEIRRDPNKPESAVNAASGLVVSQGASNNVIANIWSHHHPGNGVAVGTARYNRFEHITSENNYDVVTGGQNADGFATSQVGDGGDNEYLYCLARNNSDDGFDFWRSTGNKARYSVATANGYGSHGNGAGFKLGGSGAGGGNLVEYSLAYDNKLSGFDSNTGSGNFPNTVRHNTAYRNGRGLRGGAGFRMENHLPHKVENNLEYPAPSPLRRHPETEDANNSWNADISVAEADFQSRPPDFQSLPKEGDEDLQHLQTTLLRRTPNASANHPGLGAFEQSTCPLPTTVWLVGDSTVASNSGWGDAFGARFQWTPVKVENRALGGFSSKLFYQTTKWPNPSWKPPGTSDSPWKTVLNGIRPGDYVLIQFGHNDLKEEREDDNGTIFTYPGTAPDYDDTFRDYLELYIKETRARGATPILVTPVSRMKWKDGAYVETHGAFPAAMRQVAADNHVVLLDLEAMSRLDFQGRGETETLSLYAFPPKDGKQGISHFPPDKAWRIAKMVATLLRQSTSPLGTYTP